MVANISESAVLSFHIDNAAPPVMTSDLRWYYTASAPSGTPDFSSTDFQEITNLLSRTSISSLSYSDDMLTLTVSGIVQALIMGDETDAGRYFLRASNPAGEDSSFIDLVVYGKLLHSLMHPLPTLTSCHNIYVLSLFCRSSSNSRWSSGSVFHQQW